MVFIFTKKLTCLLIKQLLLTFDSYQFEGEKILHHKHFTAIDNGLINKARSDKTYLVCAFFLFAFKEILSGFVWLVLKKINWNRIHIEYLIRKQPRIVVCKPFRRWLPSKHLQMIVYRIDEYHREYWNMIVSRCGWRGRECLVFILVILMDKTDEKKVFFIDFVS